MPRKPLKKQMLKPQFKNSITVKRRQNRASNRMSLYYKEARERGLAKGTIADALRACDVPTEKWPDIFRQISEEQGYMGKELKKATNTLINMWMPGSRRGGKQRI